MNYNIRTFFIYLYCSVSLEKRARVDSCQRAIIVFECNNFTKKKNLTTTTRRQIIIQLGAFEMFTLCIIQIRHGVTIFIMVPMYILSTNFFFNCHNCAYNNFFCFFTYFNKLWDIVIFLVKKCW